MVSSIVHLLLVIVFAIFGYVDVATAMLSADASQSPDIDASLIGADLKDKIIIEPIQLTIHSGDIRGERLKIGAEEYAIFKGIPYAAPPVGGQRFMVNRIGYDAFDRKKDRVIY